MYEKWLRQDPKFHKVTRGPSSFFVSIFFGMFVQSIMDMTCAHDYCSTQIFYGLVACLVGREHMTKPWDHLKGRTAHKLTLLAEWQGCAPAMYGGPRHSTFALRWLGNLSFDQQRFRAWGEFQFSLRHSLKWIWKRYMYNHMVRTYQTAWVEEHARPPAG